jgi:hypothetical protein
MGWKGGACWYCGADLDALHALEDLPEEWDAVRLAEFERHMQAECISGDQKSQRQQVGRFTAWYQVAADERRIRNWLGRQ